MTAMTAHEAAQRGLRLWAFARPLAAEQGCSMACSHGRATAAVRSDVARQLVPINLEREGSGVAQAIETRYSVAQPEGLEPGPQDTPASEGGCLLQCLYLADRCDRNCAGCAVTSADAAAARASLRRAVPTLGGSDGEKSHECPDGNHGDRKISEGGTTI